VIVLAYHSVQPKSRCKFMLTIAEFESQIQYFMKKDFTFIDLNSTAELIPSKKSVLITIDDGYEDNYLYIYPILKKYNIPFSIFLATNFISKSMKIGGVELPMLKEAQIKEMYNSKLVYFGSHTHNHIFFDDIEDTNQIDEDLEKCSNIIYNILGYKPKYFVYPKGRFNEKYRKILSKHFDYAFQGIGCSKEIKDNFKVHRIELLHNSSKLKQFYHFNCLHWIKRLIK
jgi:peptidoglycan/xylan/chitin deacetylase (PgdA/CDA1 family)